ncbi:hypothetical protein [Janthinobacterium fluminis]|uniref:HEPN AbiU2-like domain-containing protein n=1 Tax=Janthinobacterium fluminis TaxID=2987524 RepID=A0ABT5K262_9BURK|nr:hypothetical protein [Janthinobacterium fluminis]MDC8757842.1 hypothetical protein [Janthinobacterium fluminis]
MKNSAPKITDMEQRISVEYSNVLNEVRTRINSFQTIIHGTASLPEWLTAELLYLQLRMLCELVAVGCLVAHGEIEQEKLGQVLKRHEPGVMLKKLESLHPDFFPKPIKVTSTSGSHHIDFIEDGFLTKNQFFELYAECHQHLHRGSVSHIYSLTNPKQPPRVEDAVEWAKRLLTLLNTHHIVSSVKGKMLVCWLAHEQVGGNSFVVIAKAPGCEK